MAWWRGTRGGRAAAACAAVLALGCACSSGSSGSSPSPAPAFGDPPPDPSEAPLEVVLERCELNRDEVGPGTHNVAVVGPGTLVVTDESGAAVLTVSSGNADLVTTKQSYTFTCTAAGRTTTARLRSA